MASKIVPKVISNLVPKDPAGTAKSILEKVAKPWTTTGPCATPEYVEAPPDATAFRKFAPATPPVRPVIPHQEPEHVFDITYFTRDRRRRPVHRTVREVDPVAVAAELQGLPPAPGTGKQYVMGKACHMDDEPGDGYQK